MAPSRRPHQPPRRRLPSARLHFAASEGDADMLYATGFLAPDPFFFLQRDAERWMAVRDLELDRARRTARIRRVLSWTAEARRIEDRGETATTAAVIQQLLWARGCRSALVPSRFPLGLAQELRRLGVSVRTAALPFWPGRARKRPPEIRAIAGALRAAEAGLAAGIAALRSCRIGRDGHLLQGGRRFTAEDLRSVINTTCLALGCLPAHTICAPGEQAVDPHEQGHGPLRAHTPIVIDVFPRSEATGYFGDLTRTVVRGRASERLREVYAAVRSAQRLAKTLIRPGVDGSLVHRTVQRFFEDRGFRTFVRRGRRQGFFHGTGHGVGLEIHEDPALSAQRSVLAQGNVVTVEPGLYYLGLGGVRLEDMVVVERSGVRTLTRLPKVLEI